MYATVAADKIGRFGIRVQFVPLINGREAKAAVAAFSAQFGEDQPTDLPFLPFPVTE